MLPTPTHFRPESLAGTTLDGRYRLVQHIASGGMGAIFRAEHVYMRKELALKVLRPDLSSLPDIAERFRREAEIAASLEHENIVRVTDFGRSPEGWLFLAMELLEGESLFERLRREGALAPEEAIAILAQVCRGLEAAHARGVVHRDLKPENIYLASPSGVVKILDFGIAKLTDPQLESDTQAGMVVGTPEYLSPEQAVGGMVDPRADVYAVGLIAWRLLAGRHPFKADDARGLLLMQATHPVPPLESVRPDLASSPGLLAAVARACAKEPGDRYPTAGALGADLEAALPAGALPLPRAAEVATTRLSPVPLLRTTSQVRASSAGVEATVVLQPDAPPPRAGVFERAGHYARTHLLAISLGAAASLLYPGSILVARWLDERPVHRALALLRQERFEAARDLLAPAVQQRPSDARLRVLQGHALHSIEGEGGAAADAYAAAAEIDPHELDDRALANLAADLSGDRKLADRAARVLQRVGARAVPAVLDATQTGSGNSRLRALEVARALGVDERVDRLGAYLALLRDEDCDVRRVAARRLGDLGDPAAVAPLVELARQTRPIKGLFGKAQTAPACAAPEAAAAVRQLQRR